MKRLFRAGALALVIALPMAVHAAQAPAALSLANAVDDGELDTIRGGFELDNGVRASIGILREVLLNGQVIAATQLIFSGLEALRGGGMPTIEQLGAAITIVQIGPGNAVTVPALTSSAPVVAAPTPAAGNVTAAPPSTTIASVPSASTMVLTSALTSGLRESITLRVQNTLNQQLIQMRTTINATVEAMNALRSQMSASNLRDQLLRR